MKTSTHHSNGKKGWPASLLLAGLVFAALVLTGCPQPSGGGTEGGKDGQQEKIDPPLAVMELTATYDATANGGTVKVSWSAPAGTTARKYQVTVAGKTDETVSEQATITGIAPTEEDATVTVVGIAKDGTEGEPATTKVTLTAKLAVAAIELRANGPASGGSQDAAVSAPGVSWNATVTFTNGGQIASGDTVQLQLYKDGTAEGLAVSLTKDRDETYSASSSAPSTTGTYTLKVLLNDKEVPGQTATITVQNPRITEITLNRTEVRPGYTITGEIKGNGALASLSSLQGTVTQQGGGQEGTFYVNSNLKFSYTVPAGTADGTYTITISQSGTPLGTVDFTVNQNAALPDMSNPFADGNSYLYSNGSNPTTWTVQGSHLVTTETYYDGTTRENWYTFTHDTDNNRITLTPYKLYHRDSSKTLTRVDYEAEERNLPHYAEDYTRAMIEEMLATDEDKEYIIAQIKSAEPGLTGLESMSNDQLVNEYFRVMLKSEGYNNWDELVTAEVTQSLKVFDVKTTYSYVADGSTGSLVATEWWDATFKTLYDAGSDYSFSYYESGSGGNNKSISIYGKNVSINEGNGGGSTDYTIQSVSGNTINLKADSGGGTATMTFGAITDKASGGSSPQKQMTVTYSGQDYTLTHRLTKYNFTIQ